MKQTLTPPPGKILVHRETLDEFYSYRKGVASLIEDVSTQGRFSPWALVVGVGKSEVTTYGTKITTDVQVGDFVAVAQVGVDLRLEAGDGTFTYIYVIPFDGVISRLEVICERESCGYTDRKNPRQLICPKCGAGPSVGLVEPSVAEVLVVDGSKSRG